MSEIKSGANVILRESVQCRHQGAVDVTAPAGTSGKVLYLMPDGMPVVALDAFWHSGHRIEKAIRPEMLTVQGR